jgi:H(+)-transporting ATP synthase subunit D
MDHLSATRMALLAVRAQAAVAEHGSGLLRDKRRQLLAALRATAEAVFAGADALERSAADAGRALALAEALDGPEAVRSAALAGSGEIRVDARTDVVMGVRVPVIQPRELGRPLTQRGYALGGTSPRIDAAAERFEAELDMVLHVATDEIRLRRLAEEAGKVTRRVNALEHVIIPRLAGAERQIEAVLEERERQHRFRLKRFADRKAHRERSHP